MSIYPAYFKIKSDFNRDRFGLILHLVFPILISQAVIHLWGHKILNGLSIALGYIAWDFFSRLLLDASKLHHRYNLICDTNMDLVDMISENVHLIFLKSIISVIFTSLFYLNTITTGLICLLLIIPPIAFCTFLFGMILSSVYDFFGGIITIYCRVGLYVSPIFWHSDNNLLLLNPSVLVIDIFRIASGSSIWINYITTLMAGLLCIMLLYFAHINQNSISRLVSKKYIRTM